MVYVRTLLYGNKIPVEVKEDDKWVNGELVPGANIKLGSGIVMPWNVGRDLKYMEAGGYTTNDRKLYSNDILHDKTDTQKEYIVTIENIKYKMKFLQDWNEGSLNRYGLKEVIL